MKKTLLSIFAMAGLSGGVYAEGTVLFQNTVGGVTGLVFYDAGVLYNGSLNLELFYGPVGDTAAQILALNTGTVFLNAPVTSGQFFDGTVVVTTGAPGNGSDDPVNNVGLVIAGWTGGASNLTTAIIAGAPHGFTAEFDNPTGGAAFPVGSPPALPANLVNWLASNPLILTEGPEPSIIALGGLGAAVILLFRRRK